MSLNANSIDLAASEIAAATRRTPLIRSVLFEKRIGSQFPIYFKAENLQYTGSFKARGALNKLQRLLKDNPDRAKKLGVITASAGNHAQGVAYHAQRLGLKAKIVMPIATPHIKIKSTRQWGAEVVFFGESYQEAYEKALELQKVEGREYVHAFDDDDIIAGQGTLAKEILEDLPDIQVFIAPIGGGGLMAGCATYFSERKPSVEMFGVQAVGASAYLPALEAGKPVAITQMNTIAEGMSVKKMGDLTFPICQKYVKKGLLVSDEEIAEGLLWLLENERLFVEGCGGATVAAAIRYPEIISGPTVVLLSGGNLDVNFLARIIERGLKKSGRLVRLVASIPDTAGSLHRFIKVFADQQASIVQVGHERIFGETHLREVIVRVTLETKGAEHIDQIREAVEAQGWSVQFL